MNIKLTSEIAVERIDSMGDDRRIVEAMLVSSGLDDAVPPESVTGRINFLMEKRHGSPFEHGALTVRVHAPIKVFREWHRHRVGWSYNEESGRYKQLDPVFYVPPHGRPMTRPEGFKSSNPDFHIATNDEYEQMVAELEKGYSVAYESYEVMLKNGIDRGLARDVLGVGIYSSCYCTANPRSIMHFLELRTNSPRATRPSKPLYEIEVAARQLESIFALQWPKTYAAWNAHGRMAP